MRFPYKIGYRLETLLNWIALNKPTTVGMRDDQYYWLSSGEGLNQGIRKTIGGVPIEFLDQPRP